MLHTTSCPVCGRKQTVPEEMMRLRIECPHCHSLYAAGSSTPLRQQEAARPGGHVSGPSPIQASPARAITQSLAETPTIGYQCPRCKLSLESPCSVSGKKLNCPGCGQRLQVPKPLPAATLIAPLAVSSLPATPRPSEAVGPEDADAIACAGKQKSRAAPSPANCLECGHHLSGQHPRFTCPKCGSLLCSAACLRDHNHFAHNG
jgi:DNA-directed RNA polymerase subunit RPC12/RpoP